jgi:uncharacterized membrane protein
MGYRQNMLLIIILSAIFTFISIGEASAAVIHGTIYDVLLQQESNIQIEVNTIPKQVYIAKNGTYSLILPIGNYTITTHSTDSISQEEVEVIDPDGDYVIDFILIPTIENPDIEQIDNISVSTKDPAEYPIKTLNAYNIIFMMLLILVLSILIMLIFIARKTLREKKSAPSEAKQLSPETQKNVLEDEYGHKILEILRKESRITQKELRKELPLSEGKISLIISDLEHQGKLKKIKRGRGNILVYIKS